MQPPQWTVWRRDLQHGRAIAALKTGTPRGKPTAFYAFRAAADGRSRRLSL